MGIIQCCDNERHLLSEKQQQQAQILKELKYKETNIQVIYGCIINDDSDAFLLLQDRYLSFQSCEQAREVKKIGGQTIFNECQNIINQFGYLDEGQIVYTHAGDLNQEFIFHLYIPDRQQIQLQALEQQIFNCIYRTLEICFIELKLKSIALPLISNQISASTSIIACVMLKSIQKFIDKNQNNDQCSINSIKLINEQLSKCNIMRGAYEDIFENKNPVNLKQSMLRTFVQTSSKDSFSKYVQDIMIIQSPTNYLHQQDMYYSTNVHNQKDSVQNELDHFVMKHSL